jgi:hypothetical protein
MGHNHFLSYFLWAASRASLAHLDVKYDKAYLDVKLLQVITNQMRKREQQNNFSHPHVTILKMCQPYLKKRNQNILEGQNADAK